MARAVDDCDQQSISDAVDLMVSELGNPEAAHQHLMDRVRETDNMNVELVIALGYLRREYDLDKRGKYA